MIGSVFKARIVLPGLWWISHPVQCHSYIAENQRAEIVIISIYMQEFRRTTMAAKVAFTECSYIKSFIQCVQKINWIDNNTFLIELQHWSYFTVADIEQNVDRCKEIMHSIHYLFYWDTYKKKTNTGHASHGKHQQINVYTCITHRARVICTSEY